MMADASHKMYFMFLKSEMVFAVLVDCQFYYSLLFKSLRLYGTANYGFSGSFDQIRLSGRVDTCFARGT
jgi:hypothetical protein